MARVLFITGFNRSGTTLLTFAVTAATNAATLTAGGLARHMPTIDEFLTRTRERGVVADRGVDGLEVTESTPEEYGWLLRAATGESAFGAKAAESGVLDNLIEELADGDEDRTVVLKSPFDTGNEQLLLDHFKDSHVLLIRRDLGAIEDSFGRAWSRLVRSNEWVQALVASPEIAESVVELIGDDTLLERFVRTSKEETRGKVRQLIRSIGRLPLDRVAFLSYDELRADPRAGAAWAAHLVDPDRLAAAIAEHTFPEYNRKRATSWKVRALDGYWAWAWRRARARQVRVGILTSPRRRSRATA